MSFVEQFTKSHTKLYDFLLINFLGGSRPFKQAWIITLPKAGSLLLCLFLMKYYDQLESPTAWTYTALHGSYGLLWLLKELIFPDPNWQRPVTLASGLLTFAGLVPYWIPPLLLTSRGYEAPLWKCCAATVFFSIGVSLMFGADAQKYFTLKLKRGLITTGFFARIRHPNYLGEMLLYGSFAWLSGQPESWYYLAFIWSCLFLPNMLRKEVSMRRYPEWEAYCRRAGFLWPKFW